MKSSYNGPKPGKLNMGKFSMFSGQPPKTNFVPSVDRPSVGRLNLPSGISPSISTFRPEQFRSVSRPTSGIKPDIVKPNIVGPSVVSPSFPSIPSIPSIPSVSSVPSSLKSALKKPGAKKKEVKVGINNGGRKNTETILATYNSTGQLTKTNYFKTKTLNQFTEE